MKIQNWKATPTKPWRGTEGETTVRKACYCLLAFLLIQSFCLMGKAWSQKLPIIRIGIVGDGPLERGQEVLEAFQREILELTAGEFDVRFPEAGLQRGDWTLAGINQAVDSLLEDRQIDLILSVGPVSSAVLCQKIPLKKPVIAPYIVDPVIQKLPSRDGSSGVKNLSYLVLGTSIESDLRAFQELVSFERVAVIYLDLIEESMPNLPVWVADQALQLGMQVVRIPVKDSVEEALERLPPDVQAVYVAPLLKFSPADFQKLVQALIQRKLPSFSLLGEREVKLGILAGISPETDIDRLARRVALNVQSILLGEEAGSLAVGFSQGEKLTLNMATARAIGFSPTWEILTEAVLLQQTRTEVDRKLTLQLAVQESLRSNLPLLAAAQSVEAGKWNAQRAQAPLRPQFRASASGLWIDEDRAASTFSSTAERSVSGSLSATHNLYVEPLQANRSVQNNLQRARVLDWEAQRLTLIQETATTYLNVLRAKTFEEIQKDNLKLTRSNLELARVRRSIGASNPSEVYRWESQIAQTRQAVISANAERNVAEIALNRLLHQPLEEPFSTEELGIQKPEDLTGEQRLFGILDNLREFKLFRRFMVEEGLKNSRELQALDAQIQAQERLLLSGRRSFYLPTVAAQAQLTQNGILEGGAGTGDSSESELPFELDLPDDTDWSLGVNLSLPLYAGSERKANVEELRASLRALRLQRDAQAEFVEQRIRSSLHRVGASWATIRLSRQSAEAAAKNLELLTDAYSRGTVSILELLDAQNVSLVAEQVASNAVYDFLIQLMETERSVSLSILFMLPEERQLWNSRLEEWMARN